MKLIELCKYTARQSVCDVGEYPNFYSAERIVEDLNKYGGKINMANISEYAKDYVPTAKTRNITELQSVDTNLELIDDEFEFEKDGETKIIQQKVIVVDGEQYRVPVSCIQQLKAQLEANPNMKKFKVTSTGSGMDTKYTVIPLME